MLEYLGEDFSDWEIKSILQNQANDLKNAPFDLEDEKLVPSAGACSLCPFNSANQGNLFGDDKKMCTKSTCFETKKKKVILNLLEKTKKENLIFLPKINSYTVDNEVSKVIMSMMKQHGFEVFLTNNVDIILEPLKPTFQSVKDNSYKDEITDDEVKQELKQELENYKKDMEEYANAESKGYVRGLIFNTMHYTSEQAFLLINKNPTSVNNDTPVESKKMDECTTEEKIFKINYREIRKKQIQNNKLFEDISVKIKESDYVNSKKTLTDDELIAFCFSAEYTNVAWSHKKIFEGDFNSKSNLTPQKFLNSFKKKFNKKMFNKMIRYMILYQVQLGEQNHTNNIVNTSFYEAMQAFFKKDIQKLEESYNKDGYTGAS